jgi:hypothetical protein
MLLHPDAIIPDPNMAGFMPQNFPRLMLRRDRVPINLNRNGPIVIETRNSVCIVPG